VLLLDEPFRSLDLVLKHDLFATVRTIIAGCALVLVTHDPLEALALCDTALVLESGRVVEHGALRELLTQPRPQLLRLFQEPLSVGATSGRA
jgi:molybdate transport system ATP-binding protein